MVRISKQRLGQEVLQKISDLLVTHILRMRTKRQAKQLLYELLTPTERIQLAKRFAIVTMLHREHPTTTIEEALHVSRTTIGAVEDRMEKGQYDATITELKKASRGDLVVALETIVEFSLFKGGKQKWKHLKRIDEEGYRHLPKQRQK